MNNINERLDRVRTLIQDQDFLESRGISNEVNIRIFCYEAKDEMTVRHFVEQIKADQTLKCHLIECNLFRTFLSICEDKRIIKGIPPKEEKKGKQNLLDELSHITTVQTFVEKIKYEPHKPGDVLMLTGVGEVFPFMRIHSLLEALQPHFSDVPILVLYPGGFDGYYVKLFDKLRPNEFYRAFNVI